MKSYSICISASLQDETEGFLKEKETPRESRMLQCTPDHQILQSGLSID